MVIWSSQCKNAIKGPACLQTDDDDDDQQQPSPTEEIIKETDKRHHGSRQGTFFF